MLSMSGRVPSGIAIRGNKSVPVAALIGLLLTFFALPLCAAAFTCTMPCCQHSSKPMDDHGAMPASDCGTACSMQAATPANVEVLLSPEVAHALPTGPHHPLPEITSPSVYRPLSRPCAHTRPLYVINDAFLI
jgi:hypothetical protein